MIAPARHPVRLVAPWFRWQRQRDERGGRGPLPRRSRPVFLKYASPDLVNEFLANPQRNYVFDDGAHGGEDLVRIPVPSPFPGPIRSRLGWTHRSVGLRKLFRDTHRRQYLVVCELHCDAPGFPDAAWDHICEQGFVVRRWVPRAAGLEGAASGLGRALAFAGTLHRQAELRAEGRVLDPSGPPHFYDFSHPKAPPRVREVAERMSGMSPPAALAEAHRLVEELVEERGALERPGAGAWEQQAWIQDEEHPGLGRWEAVEKEPPGRLPREKSYPLYRLIPDPKDRTHRALGARLLFGIVPTADMDRDAAGEPHFGYSDPKQRDVYEVRCWVRQHDPGCPRKRRERDCHGPIVWSEPTEPYRIATHFDPAGTKNVTVRVEMPDLRALAADPYEQSSIRLQWPDASRLDFVPKLVPLPGGGLGGPSICTTSIPLVTIVATFLLELVTPIVVNIFKLYYLLFPKFCIPVLGAGLPPLPELPDKTEFLGAPVLDALSPEFEPEELDAINAKLRTAVPRSDHHRLVFEEEILERPAVDAPRIVAGSLTLGVGP